MAGATGETNTAIACAPLQTAAESFEHAAATREATAPPATATSRSAHSGGGLPWHSSETAASATPSAAPSAASLTITDVSQLSALKADVPAPPATALPSGSPASAAARSTPLGMGADGRSSRTASPTPLSCTHARISSPAGRESSAGLSWGAWRGRAGGVREPRRPAGSCAARWRGQRAAGWGIGACLHRARERLLPLRACVRAKEQPCQRHEERSRERLQLCLVPVGRLRALAVLDVPAPHGDRGALPGESEQS
eukprot:5630714-Prymnesium_polylepis.1